MAWLHLEIERNENMLNMVGAELTDDNAEQIATVHNIQISQEASGFATMTIEFLVPDIGMLQAAIFPSEG